MDGPGDYHTKWRNLEKYQILSDSPYMQNKKKDTDELVYKTETDLQT